MHHKLLTTTIVMLLGLFLLPTGLLAVEKTTAADKKIGLNSKDGRWGFRPAKQYHKNLPRVLIIGDSICSQYSKSVIKKLQGKADVDAWVTGKHLNSKGLRDLLTLALSQGDYKVVHFNIGLHGWSDGRIPKGKYQPLLEAYVKTMIKHAPDATLIWASTTSISESKANSKTLDPKNNPLIIKRNSIAEKVMKKQGIPINDLYGLTTPHLEFKGDRFHWKSQGVEMMAIVIAKKIENALAHPKPARQNKSSKDKQTVASEHAQIGNAKETQATHTQHPDAQWFPDAGMGLFLHWSISSVKAMNISHPMIPGRPLEKKRINDPEEIKRIVREQDYYLNGKKPEITPLAYWDMAKSFNPDNYHPEKWLQMAKDAGFTYVVLTAKHHDGFAMWPSKYGNFNTKNYMGGKDLIGKFVKACHKVGIKVGIYYSGPDWYFHQNYMTFLRSRVRRINPEFPILGPDLLPRKLNHTKKEIEKHRAEFARMVKGQVDELLINYGQIDVLWFDGKPPIPNASKIVTKKYIYKLQPQIVINPRMHGNGDYRTFERHLPDNPGLKKDEWAEFCNPWNGIWPYYKRPYKPLNSILTDLTKCRSLGINYLLGIGPMANGDLAPQAYQNIPKLGQWMKTNSQSIYHVRPLEKNESASVPASQHKNIRYLYIILNDKNKFVNGSVTLTGTKKPTSVTLLKDGKTIPFTYQDNVTTLTIPTKRLGELVAVVKITLPTQ